MRAWGVETFSIKVFSDVITEEAENANIANSIAYHGKPFYLKTTNLGNRESVSS